MKHLRTTRFRRGFHVLHNSASAGAAVMTLQPGASTGDAPENEHPWAEQWLYVIRGRGRATVGNGRAMLKEGSLLLIDKRHKHQITNTGRAPLVTLNLYVPPAYDMQGDLLAR